MEIDPSHLSTEAAELDDLENLFCSIKFDNQRENSSSVNVDCSSPNGDIVEIHRFSLDDLDEYLEIYFDAFSSRLTNFFSTDDQFSIFHDEMKSRIETDFKSIEFENVLLGKIDGKLVGAAFLLFPGQTSSFLSQTISLQSNFCFASIQRWIFDKIIYKTNNEQECHIEMIGVRPEYRNFGIGTAMIESIEDFARERGATFLTAYASNEHSQNFFQRSNFQVDHSDRSSLWNFIFGHEKSKKFSKTILVDHKKF